MHMHMPMIVCPATEADLPVLCELLQLLFDAEAEFTPDADAQCRGLTAILASPQLGTILVARRDDAVVGMVNVLFTMSTALGAPVALLEDLIVAPPARGTGIGTMLLQAAFHAARAQGCKRITLLTDAQNTAAQRFYARHGFHASTMIPLRIAL